MKPITNSQKNFIRRTSRELSPEEIAKKLNLKSKVVHQAIKELRLEQQSGEIRPVEAGGIIARHSTLIVFLLAASYTIFFSILSILRYNGFNYCDFDLAIYAQVVWNILHGSTYSSILGIPFLGNHLDLLLFLIAPVCTVLPTAPTLLVLQTLFLGLGAIPLYLLARDILNKNFAIIFSILYLTYPALNYVNRYEFHPVAFATFFLLYMIYYFERGRFKPFLLFVFLAMLCKENIPLGILFFGLYVLIFRKRNLKWSLTPILSAAIWLTFGLKLMFHLNNGTIDFGYIYSHLGRSTSQMISTVVKNPGAFLRFLFSRENIIFIAQLLSPVAFLPLLSLKTLLASLPFFLQQLLSIRAEDHTIRYHYCAKLIPFIFASSIYGAKFLMRASFIRKREFALTAPLLTACIVSNLCFGLLPKIPDYLSYRSSMQDINNKKLDFVKKIPGGAPTVTTFEFLPKLSQRKGIFSFHHVYIGKYTLSNRDYVLPPDVEYALIDFDDYLTFTSFYRPELYGNLQRFLAPEWSLVEAADNIALFRKGYKSDRMLYSILEEAVPLGSTRFLVEDNITTLGYDIQNRKIKPGEAAQVTFMWECLRESDRDYWVVLRLVGDSGKILHEWKHPICYRVYPTYAWKKGDLVREYCWILIPHSSGEKGAYLKMGMFDRSTASPRGGTAKGVSVRITGTSYDSEGWIELGKIEIVQ